MPKQDKIYANGIYFNEKRENAPDFVLGSISIDIEKFDINSLIEYANWKYVKLNVLMGKDKPYVTVDTYKSNGSKNTPVSIEDTPF